MQTAIHIGAIVMLAVGVIGFLYSNSGTIASGLKRAFSGWGTSVAAVTTTTVQDDDTLDLAAWKRLQKRKSLQSPEAQSAFKILATHFLEVGS